VGISVNASKRVLALISSIQKTSITSAEREILAIAKKRIKDEKIRKVPNSDLFQIGTFRSSRSAIVTDVKIDVAKRQLGIFLQGQLEIFLYRAIR